MASPDVGGCTGAGAAGADVTSAAAGTERRRRCRRGGHRRRYGRGGRRHRCRRSTRSRRGGHYSGRLRVASHNQEGNHNNDYSHDATAADEQPLVARSGTRSAIHRSHCRSAIGAELGSVRKQALTVGTFYRKWNTRLGFAATHRAKSGVDRSLRAASRAETIT